MKIGIWLFVCLLFSNIFSVKAQYDNSLLIQKEDYEQLSVEEKLVWLAWQNRSEQRVIKNEISTANKELTVAKWNWVNNFTASFNLNEFTINSGIQGNDLPLFFPRYNLGLSLALGDLIVNPTQVKIARARKAVIEAQVTNTRLDQRAEVLEKYYNYMLAVELYQIGTQQNEETYTNFLLISEKFKSGEETVTSYNEAQRMYTISKAEMVRLEAQVNIARVQIERFIGVPLEQVLSEK